MYVLCLHADKAKGLQINLSEALQGKKITRHISLTPSIGMSDCGLMLLLLCSQYISITPLHTHTLLRALNLKELMK